MGQLSRNHRLHQFYLPPFSSLSPPYINLFLRVVHRVWGNNLHQFYLPPSSSLSPVVFGYCSTTSHVHPVSLFILISIITKTYAGHIYEFTLNMHLFTWNIPESISEVWLKMYGSFKAEKGNHRH